MNGPTMRRFACGSARRTSKPPRSTLRGTIMRSMASQAGASPSAGSLPGKKLMRLTPTTLANDCGPHDRHARPRAGHPRLSFAFTKDVDGRDKPGHDVENGSIHVERLGSGWFAGRIKRDLLDACLGLAQQLFAAALERLAALVNHHRLFER